MKTTAIVLTLIAAMGFSGVVDAAAGESRAIASGNNDFAFDLYGKLAGESGNLFFSPYSVDTALAMAYAGARGNTADQMAQVLHFSMPREKLSAAFGEMIKDLNSGGSRNGREIYKLIVANAMWGQKGYPFDEKYQNLLREVYDAGLMQVDFEKAAEQARQEINQWVEKQTNGKIKDLLGPDAIKPLTRLILTNAIYFKSAWQQDFPKGATKDAPFQLGGGQTKTVPLMSQQKRFRYFEDEQVQVLELPYQQGVLNMTVILPKKVDGLADLEKTLTQQNVNKWLDGMNSRLVQVFLPKFKIEAQFKLSETLKAMGMTDAFSDAKADFSGIASVERMYIFDVIHKAFVDVNEEGTEAAAATAVIMGVKSAMPRPEQPVIFRADHPFVFAIRHRESGAILFLGRFVKP